MPRSITQLGKALSILAAAAAREDAMHADVDLMYAPSECHRLVARGAERRARLARKHAEAVAGAPLRVIHRQALTLLGSHAALRRAQDATHSRVLARLLPY